MGQFGQDLRYALRRLRKRPLFAAVVVFCLAVGIAANATIFSVFNATLLRALPFDHPERLVSLAERNAGTGSRAPLSYLDYLGWRSEAHLFADMGAYADNTSVITEGQDPELVIGGLVSWNLFTVLGVRAQLGRLLRANDDQVGTSPVVLLSDALWKRRYASDSTIVGRAISVDGLPYTVIGVMPPGFKFPEMSEIWVPMAPELHADPRDARAVSVIGRLLPGVSVAQASDEVAAVSRHLSEEYASAADPWVGEARALRSTFIGSDERAITVAMMGAVIILLLITCANVANMQLASTAMRRSEIAVRAAIGAGKGRIVRQLLTETILLALIAGLLAVPLAREALRLIRGAVPPSDPLEFFIRWSLDLPTLVYVAVASTLTGVLFGLMPAIHASRGRLHAALKDGGDGVGVVRGQRLRDLLVVAEVALSLVLLVGASLFVRTYRALNHVELGYDVSPIQTMRFYLPGARYDGDRARFRRVDDILRRVEAVPGVVAATISDLVPLDDEGGSVGRVLIEGRSFDVGREPRLFHSAVAGTWFETFGVELLEGRPFSGADLQDRRPVAVINRAAGDAFWPGADPVGKRLRMVGDSTRTWFTVIGVAPDIRTVKLDENRPTPPTAYLPYRFFPTRDYGLMVRTENAPTSVVGAVRDAVRGSDRAIPVFHVWTMDEVRTLSFWMYGLWGLMFTAFAGIALFLAAIGLYGVIHYSVARRTRETGIRIALGASRARVIGLILGHAMFLTGAGIGIGLLAAYGLTRVVSSLLIGVSPTDPASFVGVALFLSGIAAAAGVIPALFAANVDPVTALRSE